MQKIYTFNNLVQVQETKVSKKPGIFTCNFCDISFFKEARYEAHLAGEQHRRKKARMEGVEFFKFKNKSLDQNKNKDEKFEVLLDATKALVEQERVRGIILDLDFLFLTMGFITAVKEMI